MGKLIIGGGRKLEGITRITGAKNSVLPILAATVMNEGESILYDCPNLRDVHFMMEILQIIGCDVKLEGSVLTVNSRNLSTHEIPERLVREIRSSIFLMGPMLARCGKVRISYPGGCEIGQRPIDLHLKALKELGVEIKEAHGFLECEVIKLQAREIQLDYPSVGATENAMMLASKAKGTTKIRNAAREPEIVDLQNYLNKMGAKIKGAGTSEIIIEGVDEFYSTEHRIMPDRIVAGTMAIAGAITGGDITIQNVIVDHIRPIIYKLRESGCYVKEMKGDLRIKVPRKLRAIKKMETLPYPGFPTDMQAQFMALMTICQGTSIIKETIFENRYKHALELIRMGANITVDGRIAVIQGVKKLTGAEVAAKDLRGGAALVLAGLVAEGETIVNEVKYIDRGYDGFEKMLNSLGADIYRT